MKVVALAKAKNELSAYVEEAQRGRVLVTRHGRPARSHHRRRGGGVRGPDDEVGPRVLADDRGPSEYVEDHPSQRDAEAARPGQEATAAPEAVATSLMAPGRFPPEGAAPRHSTIRRGSTN